MRSVISGSLISLWVIGSALAAGEPPPQPSPSGLSPLSYICPMPQDTEVVEDKPGKCPKCGMTLVPVRLDSAWSCPTHNAVIQEKPGKCPIDKRDLVQITASVYFTCPGHQEVKELAPGACADGQARVKAFERRPHGDHNPRHGGQFFMADDNWHHLEGTYRGNGVFRVYFYNDFTQPIPPTGFSGTVVPVGENEEELGNGVPLRASAVRNAFEGRITSVTLPLKLKAHVKFAPSDKERVFDFAFSDISKEPPAAPRTSMTSPGAPTSTAPTSPPPRSPSASAASALSVAAVAQTRAESGPPAQSSLPIQSDLPAPGAGANGIVLPTTTPELLAELTKQAGDVESLLSQGQLGAVWFPAIAAKDVAVALVENHGSELPDRQRAIASSAEKRVVLAAWNMDAFGDLGDKQKLTEAFKILTAAIAEIKTAYASNH